MPKRSVAWRTNGPPRPAKRRETPRHNVLTHVSAAAAALLLTFALAMPAFADDTTGTAVVTGGTLSLDSAARFTRSAVLFAAYLLGRRRSAKAAP